WRLGGRGRRCAAGRGGLLVGLFGDGLQTAEEAGVGGPLHAVRFAASCFPFLDVVRIALQGVSQLLQGEVGAVSEAGAFEVVGQRGPE
ncbi:hypothetical protein DDE05_25350, partial [Streptomyces cavourensis]